MSSVEPQTEKASGPRSEKGARTRERLLDAAKEIFEKHGFLEARISDIAERAGLSHGSFYYYFDSKEEIFREVATSVEDQLSAPMGEVILAESSVPPQDRIREALRRHFSSYRDQARIMGVVEQVSRYDEHVSSMRLTRHRHYSGQVAESIRQLQRRGMADTTLDPELTAAALGALTGRFAEMWLVEGAIDCSLEEGAELVASILIRVLQLDEQS